MAERRLFPSGQEPAKASGSHGGRATLSRSFCWGGRERSKSHPGWEAEEQLRLFAGDMISTDPEKPQGVCRRAKGHWNLSLSLQGLAAQEGAHVGCVCTSNERSENESWTVIALTRSRASRE